LAAISCPKTIAIRDSPFARLVALAMSAVLGLAPRPAQAQGRQFLQGHVPEMAKRLAPAGRLPGSTQLRIAIGLPLRNKAELDTLLQQLYDPASPSFHQYLTSEQFAERFGATDADYQALIAFARTNGLTITATHPNRLVLSVTAAARDIESAFHLSLRTYAHPMEARTFYAPDAEPSLDLAAPILHISGLDNYDPPRPHYRIRSAGLRAKATPNSGSGPGSTYMGKDFRAAYMPGTSLTGAGQNVGLLQFDGYYTNDIATYISQAGITTSVLLTNIPIDGGVSSITQNGSGEVSLDLEMVISMAPGVSTIFVYQAPNPSPWVDLLSRMANDNLARQLSTSWGGGGPDPAAEQIFQQMAAQGQSFFNATGDSDAFTGAIPFASDSVNITQVGATTLTTTGPVGAYVSETVWNWGYDSSCSCYVGSSGGTSTFYPIPPYQQGLSMSANGGSTTMRNVPDVALVGDNVYVVYYNGLTGTFGGTSCAAPLWAGLVALVNQQSATNGVPSAGFINPAVYAIGNGTNYATTFHDTTAGNNEWPSSPSQFIAVLGYDLCTGWGTPAGTNLINALVPAGTSPYLLVGSPTVTGGNGNGVIDTDECNLLYLPVRNLGGGTATVVHASLATTTPGVTIIQPFSTYSNIARGVTCTNIVPFQISTVPAVACGTPIQLALAFAYNEGASTDAFMVPTCPCVINQNGSLTGTSPTQRGRLNADGTNSTCAAPKSCPGTATTRGSRAYASYSYTNTSSSPVCVTVTVSNACSGNVFAVAYLGSFNPSSLCSGYLADIGNIPTPDGVFSFTVPALASFTLVLHVINQNSTCSGYTFSVTGLICPADGGGPCAAAPTITQQPLPQHVCPGGTAMFSVGAGGTGPLSYQWQTNSINLTNGIHFNGVTTSNLLVAAVNSSVLANYRCVVSNTNGSTTSTAVALTDNDTTPPSITCPPDVMVSANAGCNATNVVLGVPVATNDNCGILSVTNNGMASYALGTNLVTWTVIDTSGNTNACLQRVIVHDTTPPVITLIEASPLTNQCHAVFVDPGATASDTCAGSLGVTTNSTVNPNDVGTYTIKYTAMDPSGNSATNTRTVYIVDTTPPVITSFTNGVVGAGTNCQALMPDITGTNYILAVDNCSSVTVTQSVATNTLLSLGTNQVVLGAFDTAGNVAYCTNFVLVVDRTPPTITCPADVILANDPGECGAVVYYTTPVGQDNCSGAVTVQVGGLASGALFPVGRTTNAFLVTDVAGNTAACSFVVTVDDAELPVVTWFTNVVLQADTNCQALMPDITGTNYLLAVDNCSSVTVTQSVATNTVLSVGSNQVVLAVSDAAGNVAYCTNYVLVVDPTAPTITCPADLIVSADPGQCSKSNVTWTVTASAHCGVAAVVSEPESGSTFMLGANTVTNRATDSSGNTSICTFTVTVLDTEPPAIICPGNMTVSASDPAGAVVSYFVLATDNCDPSPAIVNNPPSGSLFPLGTNAVACTATDASGNTSSCSFTVTVFYCPKLSIMLVNTNGTAQVLVCWPNEGSSCALQFTADLTPPVQWQPVDLPATAMPDGFNCVTITNLSDTVFYRLCGGGQ
jgi:hypothetical protein